LISPQLLPRWFTDPPPAGAVGLLLGGINGLIVARLHDAAVHYHAGHGGDCSHTEYRSAVLPPNNSQPIGGLLETTLRVGTGAIGTSPFSIPYIVIIAIVVAVLVWVLYSKTTLGLAKKHVRDQHGNLRQPKVSGINVTT